MTKIVTLPHVAVAPAPSSDPNGGNGGSNSSNYKYPVFFQKKHGSLLVSSDRLWFFEEADPNTGVAAARNASSWDYSNIRKASAGNNSSNPRLLRIKHKSGAIGQRSLYFHFSNHGQLHEAKKRIRTLSGLARGKNNGYDDDNSTSDLDLTDNEMDFENMEHGKIKKISKEGGGLLDSSSDFSTCTGTTFDTFQSIGTMDTPASVGLSGGAATLGQERLLDLMHEMVRTQATEIARVQAREIAREEIERYEKTSSNGKIRKTISMADNSVASTAMDQSMGPFGDLDPKNNKKRDKFEDEYENDHHEMTGLIGTEPAAYQQGEEGEESSWGNSVYTLMYMRTGSWYAWTVYLVQLSLIVLTLINTLEPDDEDGNFFAIPPMVDTTVTLAQAVALFVLLAYSSDLIEAVLKFQDGFYPELLEQHPRAIWCAWVASCFAQLLTGSLVVFACFVLTMNASAVVDVMLNLTALLFITELDDLAFALAKMGFVTDYLQKQTKKVEDTEFPRRQVHNIYRRVLYYAIVTTLLAGFGILKYFQVEGKYLPTVLYVQFGDAYNSNLAYYSGIFRTIPEDMRTMHYRRYTDNKTGTKLLSYCNKEKAWTFTDTLNNTREPCHKNYLARSPKTNSYDVTSLPVSEWRVRDSGEKDQPFDGFTLVKHDYEKESCKNGKPQGDICVCDDDHFGLDCQFTISSICGNLSMDERKEKFPAKTTMLVPVNTRYHLLTVPPSKEYVKVNDMPVYYADETYPANIIFFGGRRWVLTSESDLFDQPKDSESKTYPDMTVKTLTDTNFHAHYKATYTPLFFSSPVDHGTPDYKPSPVDLEWFNAGNKTGTFEPTTKLRMTSLSCALCDPEKGGYCESAGGSCNITNATCQCNEGYIGDHCEVPKKCQELISEGKPECNGHGKCLSTGECHCFGLYRGRFCENEDICKVKEDCKNHGKCVNGECQCPDPATNGTACEEFLDCGVAGCERGGICGYDGKCICQKPYYGVLCSLPEQKKGTKRDALLQNKTELSCLSNDDCINDGTCNKETGFCDCKPDSLYYGTKCELKYGSCVGGNFPCLNGGKCNVPSSKTNSKKSHGICNCPRHYEYFGPDCSQSPPCETDNDCGGRDRGTCNKETGLCKCKDGPTAGKRCEYGNITEACVDYEKEGMAFHCHHGGECIQFNGTSHCKCPTGFYGSRCEYIVEGLLELEADRVSDLGKDANHVLYQSKLQKCYKAHGMPDPEKDPKKNTTATVDAVAVESIDGIDDWMGYVEIYENGPCFGRQNKNTFDPDLWPPPGVGSYHMDLPKLEGPTDEKYAQVTAMDCEATEGCLVVRFLLGIEVIYFKEPGGVKRDLTDKEFMEFVTEWDLFTIDTFVNNAVEGLASQFMTHKSVVNQVDYYEDPGTHFDLDIFVFSLFAFQAGSGVTWLDIQQTLVAGDFSIFVSEYLNSSQRETTDQLKNVKKVDVFGFEWDRTSDGKFISGPSKIKGVLCETPIVAHMGCIPGEDEEGMVCANDGGPDEAYCSYDVHEYACARCNMTSDETT